VAYLAGLVLTIPAFLVWRMPPRWWQALDRPYGDRLKAMLQSIPGFTVGAWLLFGVFFPIDGGLGGNRPGTTSAIEVVVMIACAVPWVTTLIGGWPLWLLPPGARNQDDARYFTSHWAGIFGAGMFLGALFFVLHAWWAAVGVCLALAAVLVLIQLTLLRRRSPTGL
jgi:hypothetical protein